MFDSAIESFCESRNCDIDCQTYQFYWVESICWGLILMQTIITLTSICQHLNSFVNPEQQTKIIIILSMPFLYSLCAIIQLYFPGFKPFSETIRQCYEGQMLFSFFFLMFEYCTQVKLRHEETKEDLTDEQELDLLNKLSNYRFLLSSIANKEQSDAYRSTYKVYAHIMSAEHCAHLFPMNYCLKPYDNKKVEECQRFLDDCRQSVLQYCLLQPFLDILILILLPFLNFGGVFGYSIDILKGIQVYSVSQTLYYVVLFYHCLQEPLAKNKVLLKFLTIKITVFFTFWQALVLGLIKEPLASCYDTSVSEFSVESMSFHMESMLLCFEMFAMSLAGHYAYHVKEVIENCKCCKGDDETPTLEHKGSTKGKITDVFKTQARSVKKKITRINPFNIKKHLNSDKRGGEGLNLKQGLLHEMKSLKVEKEDKS